MLESYITPILMSYVDKYIKNLRPSDLNLSLWGGDVSLSNLELNLHALEKELNLPITFLSGKIHELHIHVPWTKLYYEPAVITINTIECVLKLRENDFTAEGADETLEVEQEDIKLSPSSSKLQAENESPLPPGYVQSLLNKVIYNLTVRVNNFILKYVEDDIVLSINVKSAEFHSANANWVKEFVDVAAPDWILHKLCNISDLTVCLDRRNVSGIIEMYQDPLAYKCSLSCRIQVHYDKEGFHLPLEKNVNVHCECLEISVTDQQLPLLLRLLKLALNLYYGTLDLPGCEASPHPAKDLLHKKDQSASSSIISGLPGTFIPGGVPSDTNAQQTGWFSWAMSMVPAMSEDQKPSGALLLPQVSRFGVYISQASLNFKITEPVSEGNFLGSQRFVFKPILTIEASGVASELIAKGISFFDFQFGVTSLTGWVMDQCVCKNGEKLLKKQEGDDNNITESEEELFLRLGGKDHSVNKGISFVKGSLFDQEFNSAELPELVANADEFLAKNSESNVLSRFGAMFFEYLYTMEIEEGETSDYYESTPSVKEVSHQRLIVGPSMIEINSGVVHRMELVLKLAEEDTNSRKEKDDIFYDEFVEDQLLTGTVSHRHMHVTVFDASLVIVTSDHSKCHPTHSEPLKQLDTSLSEIQEEEKEPYGGHIPVTTGCVFQVERLDLQRSSPMYPNELLKLIKQKDASKLLLQHAHVNMFAKVFGFQVGVSRHDIESEDPMILNVIPACNMSLFAKQSLLNRQHDDLSDIEIRFELAMLSLNVTKPQWMLLQDIYTSWMASTISRMNIASRSSLIQDVFHPSAKQGGKIPVLIEASIQDIKAQLHVTSENICSSGSVGSIRATVLSLTGEKTEFTPVLYGPLVTTDLYNGECFKNNDERSFLTLTAEPWFGFTLKVPLDNQNEKHAGSQLATSGAVLLKCKGTVINLDPVLYTWLSYQPRVFSSLPQASSKGKLRRTPSQSRIMSAATPRKKSYARGHVSSKSPSHARKKQKHSHQKEKRPRLESSGHDFDGWVWEKLPLLASVVLQVDVESFVFLAPSSHLTYDIPEATNGFDIPRNFIYQLHKGDSTIEDPSGLVVALPTLKIRSSNHQNLAVCQDILRHPLTLPPREQAETLPWVLTADNATVFTVWRGDSSRNVEIYFVLDPMCSRAMLASARTSRSGTLSSENQQARLDFVLHTDFNPLTVNCSKKQVDLLIQLYSSVVRLTTTENLELSSHDSDTLLGTRTMAAGKLPTGRFVRRTASITSSSGFEVVEEDSVSSESTPKSILPSPEPSEVSPLLVRVSLWVQWTLPKLSFHVFGSNTLDGSDVRITTELEDLSASFDYQNGHFKTQCKIGNLSITHYQIGPTGQWRSGPGGGTLISRQDSLSTSFSKVHFAENENDNSDPGPHGFLYVEYTGSSVDFPKLSKDITEHDELFENSFRYRQEIHVTIQPVDVILWCPMLYIVSSLFERFNSYQLSRVESNEPKGISSLDCDTDVTQTFTNLPGVNIKLRGFCLVVPTYIDPSKDKGGVKGEKRYASTDLFAVQGSSLVVTSRPDNPISRIVVDKKLSKSLRSFTRGYRGAKEEGNIGDVQYQLDIKGLRVWSGCWEELCRTLPRQNTAETERDLFEQNPALEWNTYSAQDRTSTLVIPIISEFDIKSVIALPVSLCVSNQSQSWYKPIHGLSLEFNLSTDVECFLSKSQVRLMHCILAENITNNVLPNEDSREINEDSREIHTVSHRSGVHLSDEKLDSGVGSECSHEQLQKHVTKPRGLSSTADVQPMECLFTAGGLSVCIYERETGVKKSLVPVLRVAFIQLAFTWTRLAESDTVQISCFDLSLAKSTVNSRRSEEAQLIPSSEDFNVVWFRTGDGCLDKRTELPPAFVNFKYKIYPISPADLKLDFGRPIWIDLDLDLLERLKCFTTDLWPQDERKSASDSNYELFDSIRSMALSTDYVALTLIAGLNHHSAPSVKLSVSSVNLGASFKMDEEDLSQRVAANLNVCALTLSTSVDNVMRSLLLPYDALVDLETYRVSPSASEGKFSGSAVSEIFIWLDSGLLQINFGQEHLRCINLFSENILEFIPIYLEADPGPDVAHVASTPSSSATPVVVHRSYDDLRTGPFQYITSAATGSRPAPYEILFTDDGPPTMLWRYPEPRALAAIHITPVPFTTFASYPSPVVMEEDRLLPCILRYWDNIQKSYIEYATFYISENSSTDVDLRDPMLSPISDVIAASEWQVVANIAVASDDSDASSDDGASSIVSEQSQSSSPISATSLAACMKVDSIFCSQFIPTLSISATINVFHLTVFNHLENIHDTISKKFKDFNLQDETPKEQEFVRLTAEGTNLMFKTWPTDMMQFSFLLCSNTQADVLDYRDLKWSSLLSPLDLSLEIIKNFKEQGFDDTSGPRVSRLSLSFCCGDVVLDASQSRIHTLATGLMAWQGAEDPVLSHFIVCNNTNVSIRFGQFGTDEDIILRSKEMAFYSWRSRKNITRQNLRLCLETEGEYRWCEPFGIDSPGVMNRTVHHGLHTATLVVEVKRKSGLQRQVVLHSSHMVTNYTSHDIGIQLLQNPALTQVSSPTLQVLHNIVVPAHSSSPSYVISHGGLAGIRVRLRGETTWSGTLPLEDQLPHYKQHCVVQMLGTKEFKNFYIWYNVTSVDNFFGQLEISFSPLFIIRNHLPHSIEMTAISAAGDVTTSHEAPGQAIEHQVFDLPPDTWYYVTFRLKEIQLSSNPPVPLNTTLFELTDKVKMDSDAEEIQKAKWPYSSNSGESCGKSYQKPAETTLVRHVQSCQNQEDEQQEKGTKTSSSVSLELQCQILSKWSKLRSIVLEVKPWSLVENKTSVTLYLEDNALKTVFDIQRGQVISPTKLQSFRIGVLPRWLEEVFWSDVIHLVDNDQQQPLTRGLSLQQYAQIQCSMVLPNASAPKVCSILITSAIACGIRVITLEETTRVVSMGLPRPLLVQPVVVNDVTSKIKKTTFSTDSQIVLNPGAPSDIISSGIMYWELLPGQQESRSIADHSLNVLVFGLTETSPNEPCSAIQWSRPVRIQQGIVRQCVSFETLSPGLPLSVVVITLIESGLIKVVISEDHVPRILLTNYCADSFQFGQCPSLEDKQNARKTSLSARDLVVSENLEMYTKIPRLESKYCIYYEPPECRESFLTKKPQYLPKLRVQFVKQANIKEVATADPDKMADNKVIDLPQGWSEPVDIGHVGKVTYNVPGNYRLHVEVAKKTSFLTHVIFRDTCNGDESSGTSQESSEIKVKCNASSLSLCLHDESPLVEPVEVLRVNLEEASFTALCDFGGKTHVELHLDGLQIDNQMENDFYHFPVVVVPLENESRNSKREAKKSLKPLLDCCLDFSVNDNKTHVHLMSIALEPMSVFIEDTFLYRLVGMLESFILPVSETRAATGDDFRAVMLASAVIDPVMIDRLDIAPLYVLVTFHASVKLFVSADHTPLYFGRFHMTSVFTDPSFLAQLLAAHYAYSALMKVGWILGSLDIIGSPANFIRSLGQGLVDFFYLPYDGLTRGPAAFVTGITSGMSSFMSHISAGALTSLTNLASSISRNMDRLTFDEQYIRLQEQQRAVGEPRQVISGFTHGCRGFLLSVLCAVAGVADQPMQELFRAENVRDATSGLVTGVGKGLIGVVTKPLGGAMELVSQTGQGILQGTGLGETPRRLYEPEERGAVEGSSSHLKYFWKLLGSKRASDNLLSVNVSVFVSGNPHFDAVLIMSSDSILFVDRDGDTILKAFSLKQLDMREDPQHPRALLLVHHLTYADTISEVSSATGLLPSHNATASMDMTARPNSRQSFSDNESLVLALFMDPVYLQPLLGRFRLFKGGY